MLSSTIFFRQSSSLSTTTRVPVITSLVLRVSGSFFGSYSVRMREWLVPQYSAHSMGNSPICVAVAHILL